MNDRYEWCRAIILSAIAVMSLLASSLAWSRTAIDHLPLIEVADVPLSGHATRWDYESFDPKSQRLFIAHLGDSVVTVFDTQQQKVIADIGSVSRVHGVLFVPQLNRVYASATGTDEVVAIDAKTLKISARIPAGDYPDGMAYAPDVHKLYVSDEHGGTETVIDVRANKRLTTISLGGEVGNTQYDPVSKHIFVNVQTRGQLVEIDPSTDKILTRIDLPGAEGNHGLYIDPATRLAFIACDGNDKLLALDLRNRRIVATFNVAEDPDVLAFDARLGWLYVAGESGEVSLFEVKAQTVNALGTAWLGPNAHAVAVDPASHLAYFPLKAVQGKPVLRITRALP